MNKSLLLLLFFAGLFVLSCQKNSFITGKNAQIAFSSDTLFFDTVFTSTGSVTQSVKIINGNNQKLRLSAVRLMGGQQSMYKIIIDGVTGPELDDIVLDANDSIYIFVAVTINPGAANLPFVVRDSIQVSFNGNQQYIQLQAWGQNAHFLNNAVITGATTWDATLPYVILGGLQVDTNATLTIQKGSHVYFHANAPMLVDGTLLADGEKGDSNEVFFLGDRLDEPYRDYPGSWPGIFFRGTSKDNHLQYAAIRNAYQGIITGGLSVDASPKILLDQCVIDNVYDAGILASQSDISAANCLISNCGRNIVLGYGGRYDFTNCTVASFSNGYITHTQPVLNISNYLLQGNAPLTAPLTANFLNCIFWGAYGTVTDEVVVSQQGTGNFTVGFSDCLWKVQDTPAGISQSGIIADLDPLFDSVSTLRNYYDFHLKPASPAIGKGQATGLAVDLDGNPRGSGAQDLGAYQSQ
ncbi:MAG: choice-of-anchor Q domain-containing protein [Puia sp.]|nr:choice-of-anchor Q domain-containing protein [Puia sp.]